MRDATPNPSGCGRSGAHEHPLLASVNTVREPCTTRRIGCPATGRTRMTKRPGRTSRVHIRSLDYLTPIEFKRKHYRTLKHPSSSYDWLDGASAGKFHFTRVVGRCVVGP